MVQPHLHPGGSGVLGMATPPTNYIDLALRHRACSNYFSPDPNCDRLRGKAPNTISG